MGSGRATLDWIRRLGINRDAEWLEVLFIKSSVSTPLLQLFRQEALWMAEKFGYTFSFQQNLQAVRPRQMWMLYICVSHRENGVVSSTDIWNSGVGNFRQLVVDDGAG